MRKFFVKTNKNLVFFNENDFKHLKVLRIKKNDIIDCFDEDFNIIKVKIEKINPYLGIIAQTIINKKNDPYNITCFLAVIKKQNFELAVEKLNELNILKIIPVYFEHSKKEICLNYDRINKIIDSSCKQSNRTKKIILDKSIDFNKMSNELTKFDFVFVANEKINSFYLKDINISNDKIHKANLCYIIGPEGGFSKKEFLFLEKFHNIKLTNTILKSETAAIFFASNLIERFYCYEN